MNQMRNISVKPSVLESLAPHLSTRIEGNRYHLSYAVWQLARMGSTNETGELPLAIRLESTGDFTELYLNRDRLVCPVDLADSDLLGSDIMLDALVRCAVFSIRSRREDMLDFLIVTSSKQAENAPLRLSEWEQAERIRTMLGDRLEALKTSGVLRDDTDVPAVVPRVLNQIGIAYSRRRHGHLGEEALWGRELDAVKVLEDAGIDGSDLAAALANLAIHAAGKHVRKRKGGIMFSRNDAMLMIRDYQRRARIQRPGVQVIDLIYMDKAPKTTRFIPRIPGWQEAADPGAIRRDVFESAVKWARLAALKSGRGLLPIFFFTGKEGNGKSFLLKQVAWKLYQEGFAVAQIVDLEEAAKEAESLATAAVALDAPLILVWDEAMGAGQDGIHALKEFSDAQLSGVPMMILAAASDAGYNPKKIRQISRTSFEEFEIQGLDEAELERIAKPPEPVPVEAVTDGSKEPEAEDNISETVTPVIVQEGTPGETGTAATEDTVELIPEEPVESAHKLQEQQTDQLTIMVSQPEGLPRTSMLEGILRIRSSQTLDEYASQLRTAISEAAGDAMTVFDLMCSWNILGLPLPEKVASILCGDTLSGRFRDVATGRQDLQIGIDNSSGIAEWDCGHPVLARAIWKQSPAADAIGGHLERSFTCVLKDPALQPLAGRLMRSLHYSRVVPPSVVDELTAVLINRIASADTRVSTVVLADLYQLASSFENDAFQNAVVDALADSARLNSIDSYIALTPLLRNRLGGIEEIETLDILKAAKPDIDRIAFKFLLKFLGDHQPNELREQSVDNARTAAARAPDNGFAVAAYLRFCWSRGTEEQIQRSIEETQSWLSANPDDRIVRRAFIDYVVTRGSEDLRRESIEPLEDWLADHMDEGPLRNSLIELAFSVNDPAIGDRVLEEISRWIEKRGNNRSVRQNYFRRAEKRNDPAIMQRACDVAVSWLSNHSDDRETIRSLLFIASRLGEAGSSASILAAVHTWLTAHVVERDILRRYLMLADRGGRGRSISHAVEIGVKWIEDNPDDQEIREIVLGMTARKVDRKIQIKVYDSSIRWLESLESPDPSMEYMIGRLGVRAGIARRAIPLLERTVAKAEGELRNHARLWLGSAYRVAEAYLEARNVWQSVKTEGDAEMAARAERNLESLEAHLKEKFPKGFPPPDDRPVRRRPPAADKRTPGQSGDEAVTGTEGAERRSATGRAGDGKPRFDRERRPMARPERDQRPGAPGDRPRIREDRPEGDRRPPRRFKDHPGKGQFKPEAGPKIGATLGDLFRMKGLDLSALAADEPEKEKPENK